MSNKINKRKIFNDPIYDFISIPFDFVLDIIDNPYFQRLRRIKQLGLTSLVYPGALHNRFEHALGAMSLMVSALQSLKNKGVDITDEEYEAVILAILLHDIGHGPFSHALEFTIVENVHHEQLSEIFMQKLNEEYDGKLNLAIKIFKGDYHKLFLHELVSSQLDMDRLDYLIRDSFYCGVSEGVVPSKRLIELLDVKNGRLAINHKGIYSVEKFLVARRIMYWQVYFHKTAIAVECMLVNALKRAKVLANNGVDLFCTPAFKYFLYNKVTLNDFKENNEALNYFSELDDFDILSAIKVWQHHSDPTLSFICKGLIQRKLWKIKIQKSPFEKGFTAHLKEKAKKNINNSDIDISYYFIDKKISNSAYQKGIENINIFYRDGSILDITQASDNFNIEALSNEVAKYYICFPSNQLL